MQQQSVQFSKTSNQKKSNSMSAIKLVVLESPYSGDVKGNVRYAQKCMNILRAEGHAVFVPHLLWTQHELCPEHFVSDYDEKYTVIGRDAAIECIKRVRQEADLVVFFVDRGWSSGMKAGLQHCKDKGIPYVERSIEQQE
jgi:ABC-type uncharacterized transport system ATPase subunit